jgi:dihydrofolate reductase
MSKIVTFVHTTLDGVAQGPGSPDEDRSGGFDRGGWAPQFSDETLGQAIGQHMGNTGALLFGRKTYEHFFQVWPNRKDGNPFTPVLNKTMKYVVSRTLKEPLPWQNSTLLSGDAAQSVARLRQQKGESIVILGSISLVQSLLKANLIDELTLTINPILIGGGRRLLDNVPCEKLRLASSMTTPKGVIMVTYEPEQTAGKAA